MQLVHQRKPKVVNNRATRKAAEKALKFVNYAKSLKDHEYPNSPEQQRQALHALVKLCVQVMLTERLTAVPLGAEAAESDPFQDFFTLPLTRTGKTWDALVIKRSVETRVPLVSGLLITSPWEDERYNRALLRSGPGWHTSQWEPQDDQSSILHFPWGVICIENGNHSAASGYLVGDGVLSADLQYDWSEVLPLVELTREGISRVEDQVLIGSSSEWPLLALMGLGQFLLT